MQILVLSLLSVIGTIDRPARAQSRADTMAGTVAQWWTMEERSFVSLADAVPEARWTFKPTDGAFKDVRTFAQQVKHVACANMAFFSQIEKKDPPPAKPADRIRRVRRPS